MNRQSYCLGKIITANISNRGFVPRIQVHRHTYTINRKVMQLSIKMGKIYKWLINVWKISTLLVNREIQINIHNEITFLPTTAVKIKNKIQHEILASMLSSWNTSVLLVGLFNNISSLKYLWQFFIKLVVCLSRNLTPMYLPDKYMYMNCIQMFIVDLLTTNKLQIT